MISSFNTAQCFKEPEMRRTIAVNCTRGNSLFETQDRQDCCDCALKPKDPRSEENWANPEEV